MTQRFGGADGGRGLFGRVGLVVSALRPQVREGFDDADGDGEGLGCAGQSVGRGFGVLVQVVSSCGAGFSGGGPGRSPLPRGPGTLAGWRGR